MTTPLEAAQKFFSQPYPWWLENMVLAVMNAYDDTVEYEYGYVSPWRDDNHIVDAGIRTPDEWRTYMGTPYRRTKAIPAGEWEEWDVPVTYAYALDPRPWLRPGGHPVNHPAYNRSARQEAGDWTFSPQSSYEQDYEKYGFKHAPCGRVGDHWPHGGSKIAYCNGAAK